MHVQSGLSGRLKGASWAVGTAVKLFVYKSVIEIASSVFFSKENELLFDNFD